MKAKEMNNMYGQCVSQFANAAHESIYLNHLSTPETAACLQEILNDYFAEWMTAEICEKFWSRAPLVIYQERSFLSMQMIQDILADVLNCYFTTFLVDEVVKEVYKRVNYEREMCWQCDEYDG